MGVQSLISLIFLLRGYLGFDLFCTLSRKAHLSENFRNTQMCNLIVSIFSMNEECIKVNLHTKFAVNIQGVVSIYSHKKIKFLSQLQGKMSMGII